MSQQCHKYALQYSTFATERPQVQIWGRQTFFVPRAPSNRVTLLHPAHWLPMGRRHLFFFIPACPWPAKQLHGLLTNIKQKQFNFYSDSDLVQIKTPVNFQVDLTSLHKGDWVELINKDFFTKRISIDHTRLQILLYFIRAVLFISGVSKHFC